jgi:hypothetical protein
MAGAAAADAGFVTMVSGWGQNAALANGFPENSLSYIGGSWRDKSLLEATTTPLRLVVILACTRAGCLEAKGIRPFVPACQLHPILLWMHKGLGYIYVESRVERTDDGPHITVWVYGQMQARRLCRQGGRAQRKRI